MPPNMKQIAGLFNDCIETIRNEKHDNLEQMAIDWLRDARYQLMRSIEAEYYKLVASIENPTQQQGWALYPHNKLSISTIRHAPILLPYSTAINNNIQELMDACGFNSTVTPVHSCTSSWGGFYLVEINFPNRLTDARNEHIPRTLHVKDAIDTTVAINFARLIEGGDENGNPSIDSGHCILGADTSIENTSADGSVVVRHTRRQNLARGIATIFGGLGGRGYTGK